MAKYFTAPQAKRIGNSVLGYENRPVYPTTSQPQEQIANYIIAVVDADIAADDTGDVSIETTDGQLLATKEVLNPHAVTLEQGLRVQLQKWAGFGALFVAVPMDFSSCDEEPSPYPIDIL